MPGRFCISLFPVLYDQHGSLGAIPVLGQVMSATRGATDAFSGVQRHVNSSQVATHVMERLGIDSSSTLLVNQGMIPAASLQSGKSVIDESSYENQSIDQLVKSASNRSNGATTTSPKGTSATTSAATNAEYTSRTENVLNNFLKNLKEEGGSFHEQAGARLQIDNNVLQMVLKHQVLIEELMQENEKLRQILVDELKVQPSRLQSSASKFSCIECYECRRRQRKR
ncbi:hypothetical protein C2S51_001614 [Perilla frutescens var. frutescens]|nr:hypothetical protein C2S51_001614 [Perilla frutescens var. frutescens]